MYVNGDGGKGSVCKNTDSDSLMIRTYRWQLFPSVFPAILQWYWEVETGHQEATRSLPARETGVHHAAGKRREIPSQQGRRWEPSLGSFPLTSTHMPWHVQAQVSAWTCMLTHTYIKQILKKLKLGNTSSPYFSADEFFPEVSVC